MKKFRVGKRGFLLVKSTFILCAFFLIPSQQASLASSFTFGSNPQAELTDVVRVASNFLTRSAWGNLEKWRGSTLSDPISLYDPGN